MVSGLVLSTTRDTEAVLTAVFITETVDVEYKDESKKPKMSPLQMGSKLSSAIIIKKSDLFVNTP